MASYLNFYIQFFGKNDFSNCIKKCPILSKIHGEFGINIGDKNCKSSDTIIPQYMYIKLYI
jgi:hypothetical protein